VTAATIPPPGIVLERPTVLALSGGGAQGAAQAGAAVELLQAGLTPDLVIGTSIGAWNGAWIAAHPHAHEAETLLRQWLDPEIRRLFRGLLRGYLRALARRRIAALNDARISALLARTSSAAAFADLRLPLAVATVDLLTAELLYLDSGPLQPAIRAASAIPTLLPPVVAGERLLADAGFIDNFGVVEAVRRGARTVVLIDASVGVMRGAPACVTSVFDRVSLVTRIHQRQHAFAAAAAAGVTVELLEVAGHGKVLDFAGAARQIEAGRAVARRWLRARAGSGDAVATGVAWGGHVPVDSGPALSPTPAR
jgi:NTE family protein